ncbi:MAG: Rhodoferax phage [Pseudomonadota bacterium]
MIYRQFVFLGLFSTFIAACDNSAAEKKNSGFTTSQAQIKTDSQPTQDNSKKADEKGQSENSNLSTSPATSQESVAKKDTIYRSRKELFYDLGITDGSFQATANSYGVCFNVAANQYVDISAQAEFTTSHGVGENVGLGWNIIRVSSNGAIVNITIPVMQNITRDMHHMVITPRGIDDSVEPGAYCYYLRNWAVSSAVPGKNIQLEQGYGEIIAIVRNK